MKLNIKAALLWMACFATLPLAAQNMLPVFSNVSLSADTANHMVTVNYDLNDVDGDSMEVWIQVSADSGRTWRVAIDALSGDQGFPVLSGTGKSLVWSYLPNTLAAYGPGLANYQVRLIADDRQPVDLQLVTDMVDSARLHQQLLALEGIRHRTTGLPKLTATRDSLAALMDAHNLHPYFQGGNFSGYTCRNVIGRSSGTRRDSACWQISGHYDTVQNAPGGDDNATAVACVSEAIRVLSNFQTKESLRYFFFDLEEAGLVGSSQYVDNGGIPSWEQPRGLLNMDCIGFYNNAPNSQVMPNGFNFLFPAAYFTIQADSFRGNFLTSIVNTASHDLDSIFVATATAHVPTLKVVTLETPGVGALTPDLRRSDHAPFWDSNYPAIFFSDGADFRNPNYHTNHDTVGTINMDFYVKNVRAIVTTLARLAQLEHSTVADAGGFDITVPVGLFPAKPVIQQPKIAVSPNPSDGRMQFRIEMPVGGQARIDLIDHHGQLIQTVYNGWLEAGNKSVRWQGSLSAGQYAAVLITENGRAYCPVTVQR